MTCLISSHIHWTVMRVESVALHMPHCYHSTFGAVRDIVFLSFFISFIDSCFFSFFLYAIAFKFHPFIWNFIFSGCWWMKIISVTVWNVFNFFCYSAIRSGSNLIRTNERCLVGENWSWTNFSFFQSTSTLSSLRLAQMREFSQQMWTYTNSCCFVI